MGQVERPDRRGMRLPAIRSLADISAAAITPDSSSDVSLAAVRKIADVRLLGFQNGFNIKSHQVVRSIASGDLSIQ